ncbi:hypothetical protein [Dictyobacter aurantiacus]|uniref:Uncharacterized protein n=1 Tax=Dictyobacter aurantiacus TaxID=1936993 RepID=A0A401ZNX3_9CHLR|nr:hypothetical protein [Dictyobacter aurantiacus]GCE08510.1 hypothetical protein KDAU_58390 [Dictyobacter aurantiacus]
MATRILQIILGIAGLGALALGILIWTTGMNVYAIHMLCGLIVALTLLVGGILAVTTRELRIWGIVGIIYALIVPVFGITQFNILPGNLHWLIQTAHLLVGLGAIALAGNLITRSLALKRMGSNGATARSQIAR